MNVRLQLLVDGIKNGITSEDILKKMMIDYIVTQSDVIPTILKILAQEREEKDNLVKDMNARLTFTTLASMQKKIDKKQMIFQIVENKKFYEQYTQYVRTAGVKLWDDIS